MRAGQDAPAARARSRRAALRPPCVIILPVSEPMDPSRPPFARRFDGELTHLSAAIAGLGGKVEAGLADALEAIARDDPAAMGAAAARMQALDAECDRSETRITELLALNQPVARDLRALLCFLKVAGALRRAAGLTAGLIPPQDPQRAARAMADPALRLGGNALAQLSDALTAWAQQDLAGARAVWRRDAGIDGLYGAIIAAAGAQMAARAEAVAPCSRWLMTARNLERVADLAAEIAAAAWRRDAVGPIDGDAPGPAARAEAGAEVSAGAAAPGAAAGAGRAQA